MSVQDLARSLTAVGSAKLPSEEGQGLYLLSVRDGNLVEKFWVGHTLQNETVIASDARDDTSASYLLGLEDEPVCLTLTPEVATSANVDTLFASAPSRLY